ncbi:MAG: HDOD domain-containing protein [Thiobacillaceae bacterium]|nr:HDOD domain-containing protein [Thiobacillaceae bacterium]
MRSTADPATPPRPHTDPEAAADGASLATPAYITREALFDRAGGLVGYRLGVRPRVPLPVIPGATDVAQIQGEALLTTVIDLDYQQALGDKLTLLDLHPACLDSPLLQMLQPQRTLLSVPAALAGADLPRLERLARQGYGLVYDDTPQADGRPESIGGIYSHACIDTRLHNAMSLGHSVIRLRGCGIRQLIACHVDTPEAFEACHRLGFQLFQGAFHAQPPTADLRFLRAAHGVLLDLLNQVMAQADFPVIESVFKRDAALSLKLLRYINSAAVGLRQPIGSIGQALALLGHDQLYRWLSLLLFTHGRDDTRSRALLKHALVRARLAENLGECAHLPTHGRGALFITGILSMLDILLGRPLDQALEGLRLPEDIRAALLDGRGPYAAYLEIAKACEHLDQARIDALSATLGLTPDLVNLAHIRALIWSEALER